MVPYVLTRRIHYNVTKLLLEQIKLKLTHLSPNEPTQLRRLTVSYLGLLLTGYAKQEEESEDEEEDGQDSPEEDVPLSNALVELNKSEKTYFGGDRLKESFFCFSTLKQTLQTGTNLETTTWLVPR